MKKTQESDEANRKKIARQALKDLVAQSKEWRRDNKGSTTEVYLTSPPKIRQSPTTDLGSKTHKRREGQPQQFQLVDSILMDKPLTPKTLQRIDAANKFRLGNASSQEDFSNDELTLDNETQRESKYYGFTMGKVALNSRASPRHHNEKEMYSPATLSELYDHRESGQNKKFTFARFCDTIHTKGWSEHQQSVKRSCTEFSQAKSPYTLNKFSDTEDILIEGTSSLRSGSDVRKRQDWASGLQEEVNVQLQIKVERLTQENLQLRDSNGRYKEEIAHLGMRIELLAHRINQSSTGDVDNPCAQCSGQKKTELERQMKKLQKTNATLEAKLRQSLMNFPMLSSPQKTSLANTDLSTSEVVTSRMRTSNRPSIGDVETKKVGNELKTMTTRHGVLEKENAALKLSSVVLPVELERFGSLESMLKKRTQELEAKRKENLSLQFDKRSLENDLNTANRKVMTLNKDIATIHNELNLFAASFEKKLEAAIAEKDVLFGHEMAKMQAAIKDYDVVVADNDRLRRRLAQDREMLRRLTVSLRKVNGELETVKSMAANELRLKTGIAQLYADRVSKVKQQIHDELENEVSYIVAKITVDRENEFSRIKKDNIHLSKEINELRHEMAAEELLGMSEKITSVKAERGQPKLFTQATLMLDFPKLLEDLQVAEPDQK